MVRLITPADYRSMRWKNGGGSTTEIAAYPPGAALDDFTWRTSIADVERGGPFSRFPGVDRTIVLLEGAGMRLHGGSGDVELRTPYKPHVFSGDEAIDCTLLAGPVRDFNAMFRRGHACGTVAVVRGRRAEFAATDFRLVFAATGTHEFVVPGHAAWRIAAPNAALVERSAATDAVAIAVSPLHDDAVALVVSIEAR